MWRVTHRSRDRLSYLSRESWFGQAFSSIFLMAGLAILYGLFFIGIPKLVRSSEPWWHCFLILLPLTVGGGFAWIGAWGVAGRSGIDFDHAAGRVTVWSGYFVPIWKTCFDLQAFQRIVLEAPVRRGGAKTAHWEYPVAILGGPGTRVEMELMTAEQAGEIARDLAGFLGLKIADEPRLGE